MKLTRVYLEITNVCNLQCAFCPKTVRPPHTMSEEEFALAVEKLAPVTEYLYLHLMGEPLLHPALPKLLRHAADAGMHVALTTNGTRLPQLADALLQAELYKISISLHSWEANHGPVMTDAARAYFTSCIDFARRAAQNGTLSVLRLWNGDRADRAGANEMNDAILALLHEAFPEPWRVTPRGTTLSPHCYLENEEIFDWPAPDALSGSSTVRCHGLRDHIGVLSDGTIVPCCLDGEGRMPLGNLFTDDVETVLASPRATAIREGFLRGQAVESLCRHCGYAAR